MNLKDDLEKHNLLALRHTDVEERFGDPKSMPDPEPGSYYRLTREYEIQVQQDHKEEHKQKTLNFQKEEKNRAKHPDRYTQDSRYLLKDPGPYAPLPSAIGIVLLVSKVNYVDGAFHSAVIRDHPTGKITGFQVNAEGFRAWFESEPNWEAIRQQELLEAQQNLQQTQTDLANGPTREEVDPTPYAPIAMLPSGPSTSFALAVKHGGREAIQAAAERNMAIATKTESWLHEKVADITKHVGLIAEFHQERAQSMIAKTQKIREEVIRLSRGVESLGIYSGDDVVVETIADGISAAADIPLVLFQRKLYMDEEFLINLAMHGGDWQDMDAFHGALRTNTRLKNALIPYERCVVLFQVRRKDIDYNPHLEGVDHLAWFMMNKAMNAPNHACFLLVRDGEKIYQIWLPDAIGSAERLFPKTNELNEPFKGYNGEKLSFEDLQYHDASKKSDDVALFYKRILVLLWGLNDRLELFGRFYSESDYPQIGFLSLEFQEKYLIFVHDDDDLAMDDGRPRWDTWLPKMNTYLQPGSLVLCDWEKLLNPQTSPSLVKENGRDYSSYSYKAKPTTRYNTVICSMDKDGNAVVKVPVTDYYGTKTYESPVYLNRSRTFSGLSDNAPEYLVLDGIDPKDVDVILESRSQRSDYLDYLPLLTQARDTLQEQIDLCENIRKNLTAEIVEAGLAEESLATQVSLEVIRTWRAAHKSQIPPTLATSHNVLAIKTAHKELRSIAWSILKADIDPQEIHNLVQIIGREPLALVARGDGTFGIYATSTLEERYNDILPWRWVVQADVTFKNHQLSLSPVWTSCALPIASAAERVLFTWPNAKKYYAKPFSSTQNESSASSVTTDEELGLKRTQSLIQALLNGGDLLESWITGSIDLKRVQELMEKHIHWRQGLYLENEPMLIIPIGILSMNKKYKKPYQSLSDNFYKRQVEEAQKIAERHGHEVLCLTWNPTTPLLNSGGDGEVNILKFWQKTLKDPSKKLTAYKDSQPALYSFPMNRVPVTELGILPFFHNYNNKFGFNHLDGKEFLFDYSVSYGTVSDITGKVTYIPEKTKNLLKNILGNVTVKLRNKH